MDGCDLHGYTHVYNWIYMIALSIELHEEDEAKQRVNFVGLFGHSPVSIHMDHISSKNNCD